MTLRRALFALAAVAATMTLSACVPGAAAGASPTPSASETSAPDPTPTHTPEEVAASVTISAEAIAVLDEGGTTLARYDYFTPSADVVAGLSVFLGAPVSSPHPGGGESAPGTIYE
ncbi:hypothetical protein [Agromyces sp. NPDC057865]|uniref:hypothetical protein n=1 Tax=Agromyces sp. NPDC057865 TaxID=3346267 RepID=UPI0036720898